MNEQSGQKHMPLLQSYGFVTIHISVKYNQDRQANNVHHKDDQVYVGNDQEVMEAPQEAIERTSQENATLQMSSWVNEKILNASFTSETEKICDVGMSIIDKDVGMSIIDKETPIYEVLETSRPWDL